MRARSFAVIALAVVVTWLAVSNIPPSPAAAAQGGGGPRKWEYTITSFDVDAKDRLNNLGDAGWEVCGTTTSNEVGSVIIMKRAK